jgi:tetratricopeptide (TPR) repeat protein
VIRRLAPALAAALALCSPIAATAQPPAALEAPAAPSGVLDPRSPVNPLDEALKDLRRDRLSAPALERYEAGDYRAAARLGLQAMKDGADQPALRYAVANSLAWTASYDQAVREYRALLGTDYDSRARVGIANVMVWSGQADLAEPYYRSVLQSEPRNEAARQGLALAGRELRPALTLRAARSQDNQHFSRDEGWLVYRQWSADRAWRFEAGALTDWYHSPSKLFGSVQLEPVRERLRVRAGRVNWGRLAFTAAALADGLTANTLGVFAEVRPAIGALRARLDAYDISDGNRLWEGEAQFTPGWQPLPWRLEWFGGVFGRGAQREDPRYWSPKPAYGLAFVGVRRSWFSDRSELSAWLRGGGGFTETAKASWSAGLTGRYWLTSDVALGVEAWAVDAPRPTPYRMQQVAAFLQHLW